MEKSWWFGWYLLAILALWPRLGVGQDDDIAAVVELDSLVVRARQQGFDVAGFIKLIQEDQSYHQAFQRLRYRPHRAQHYLEFFAANGSSAAVYRAKSRQWQADSCRQYERYDVTVQGDFFKKNGSFRYYTAKLYDRVFSNPAMSCTPPPTLTEPESAAADPVRGLEKYYQELKRLIFAPGAKVNVPIIGGRTAIFSEKMQPYYDYSLKMAPYAGPEGPLCYVFTVQVKPAYAEQREGRTIIKFLETYFDQQTLEVRARRYQLFYQGALFSFDLAMEVDLQPRGQGQLLPVKVQYRGEWGVPLRARERAHFTWEILD